MDIPLTLEEAKQYLRIDTTDEDDTINSFILVAKEYCENYIRGEIPAECPSSIKLAMIRLVGHFNEHRDDESDGVPEVVHHLLAPYRKDGF